MIFSFYEFITESKDYPLYKGVSNNTMKKIVDSGYIIGTGEFDSSLRELVAKGKCISATRNKDYSTQVGTWVIIFDTKKLTSSYKVVPFCENPDYYLELMKKEPLDSISKSIRKKDYGDIFWKVKTDIKHDDFGICEELIVTDKIDIKRYIKKVLYCKHYDNDYNSLPKNKIFDYWIKNDYISDSKTMDYIKNKLDELGIQNNIILK